MQSEWNDNEDAVSLKSKNLGKVELGHFIKSDTDPEEEEEKVADPIMICIDNAHMMDAMSW